jgi:hypothetical protein
MNFKFTRGFSKFQGEMAFWCHFLFEQIEKTKILLYVSHAFKAF